MMPGLIALFIGYVLLTAWQARRALHAAPEVKQGEAIRFLIISFLGAPLAVAMILSL